MTIFHGDEDYRSFEEQLAATVEEYHVLCHAVCGMANHYHLVATTQEANLSLAVRQLNGEFARWWNWRHRHVGHVFQGRFHAQIVQDDRYLLTVCRYVVLNPVRARLVHEPGDWAWSTYRATAGLEPAPAYLSPGLIWNMLGPRVEAPRLYRELVSGYIGCSLPRDAVLGDDDFQRRFQNWRDRASPEVPRREKQQSTSLQGVFAAEVGSLETRNQGIRRAKREGYSTIEIARFLGLHPNTVRKVLYEKK